MAMFRVRAETAIAILAKAPVPGAAKTRLIPLLGAHGAAGFHERMIERTVQTACRATIGPTTVWATPDTRHPAFQELAARYPIALARQPDGDLGARMAACIKAAQMPTLVIGADCPTLAPEHLQEAAAALQDGADCVVIPVEDGGYCLIGMVRQHRPLLEHMSWSVPTVMAETRHRARAHGLVLRELQTLWDVDRPEDVARMEREGIEAFE